MGTLFGIDVPDVVPPLELPSGLSPGEVFSSQLGDVSGGLSGAFQTLSGGLGEGLGAAGGGFFKGLGIDPKMILIVGGVIGAVVLIILIK